MGKFSAIAASFNNADNGWVDYCLKDLKSELNRQFGRKDDYTLWKDDELRGNQPLTNAIQQQLDNSQTLLVSFQRLLRIRMVSARARVV